MTEREEEGGKKSKVGNKRFNRAGIKRIFFIKNVGGSFA